MMQLGDLFQLALTGVRRNLLRSGLTALGVTVGVFAMVTIVALGEGLQRSIIKELTDDESQTRIMVRAGLGKRPDRELKVEGVADPAKVDRLKKSMVKRRRGAPGQMRPNRLTADALARFAKLEHVTGVRPLATDLFKVRFKEHVLDGAFSFGVEPQAKHWNERIIAGKQLSEEPRGVWIHEYTLYTWGYKTDAQQAALVGQTVVISRPRESLGMASLLNSARAFGFNLPVDPKQAELWAKVLRGNLGQGKLPKPPQGDLALEVPIAGVIRERVEEDGFEIWEDSFSMRADLFLPQPFAEELFLQVPSNAVRGYNATTLEVDTPGHVKAVERALKHEGYRTVSIGTILERLESAMAIITSVVLGLTAIAMVVAMLGIVNTMVMNVTERTREIGVLKAVGATDRQVRGLFLVESGMIGLVGGVAGIGLSLLASIPGDYLTRGNIYRAVQYRFDGSVFHYPLWLLGLAMVFAVGLSVLSALGPSTRASRIDPVAALRDE